MDGMTHVFTDTKPYHTAGYKNGSTIKVTAGLRKIGDQVPYFSVTAEIQEPKNRGVTAGGCLHKEVLIAWPELKPIVALHFSYETGAPIHAEEKAIYHAGFSFGHWYPSGRSERNIAHLGSHLRISKAAALALVEESDALGDKAGAEHIRAFVASQAARWKLEADKGIVLLDTLAVRA